MKICVYGASSNAIDNIYTDYCYNLGRLIAKRGHSLVFGGGASGVMGATAKGTVDGGGKVLGISPKFFDVDGNLFDKCTDFIFTENMRERKKLLEDNSDAFIIGPGGIGTFDEFFEILTLKQLGQTSKPIAVFNVAGYYDPLVSLLENGIEGNFMTPKTGELYGIFDDAEKMLLYLENYSEVSRPLTYYKQVNNDLK